MRIGVVLPQTELGGDVRELRPGDRALFELSRGRVS